MSTFEELGLSPAIIEALAAEGIETPTTLQEHAIPPLARGTSVVLVASPGSGLLAAYGAAILDRVEPEGTRPRFLVLTQTRAEANALAGSIARLALATGHRVAALGAAWASPERAHVLFAALPDLDLAVRSARVKLGALSALVVNDASVLVQDSRTETVLSLLATEGDDPVQVVLVSDSMTSEVREFVDRHVRRAVFVPPGAATRGEEAAPVRRGSLEVWTIDGEAGELVAGVVSELLDGEADHVLAFTRSEDAAADLGDALTLRGFLAGAPGDAAVPVWLGIDAMAARESRGGLESSTVAVVSVDVPTDADELDRRHGGWTGRAIALARPREIAHLRRVAGEAGYGLDFTASPALDEPTDVRDFIDRIHEALSRADLGAYAVLLEPLFREHGPSQVAAALASILRTTSSGESPAGPGARTPDSSGAGAAADGVGHRPPAWVKLFLSVGRRDGMGAGDLLGAITGETGISGDQVGRIELRDTFSKVDVHDSVAETVIRKLNGTSIRGRSVRVDFDRGGDRSSPQGGGGRTRREPGRRGRRGDSGAGESD